MYKKTIRILKQNNVVIQHGLGVEEIEKIESYYQIILPKDLKEFLMEALPVSHGFYNWRDFTYENVEKIKNIMKQPMLNVIENIDSMSWNSNWGSEPNNQEKKESILAMLNTSPSLIPICGHRYMANQYENDNPIFSIYNLLWNES